MDHPDDRSMSFGDHLDELRKRVMMSLVIPLPLAIVAWIFSDPIIKWLYRPLDRVLDGLSMPRGLQTLGPAEFLGMKLKLSLMAAVVVSAPWIVWQIWLFVRPGLYQHERRFVHLLIPGSAVLTAVAVSLMYYVMLPLMLQVLVVFGASIELPGSEVMADPRVQQVLQDNATIPLRVAPPEAPLPGEIWLIWPGQTLYVAVAGDPGESEPGVTPVPTVDVIALPKTSGGLVSQEFRLSTYIEFVLILMLGIVVAFQMPLVVLLLGWLGLITPREMRRRRKYALFICAAVAAIVTPADIFSMLMMLIPLYALFEVSILLLVLAPASAVAEGRVWRRFGKSSDKGGDGPGQNDPPTQTDRPDGKAGKPSHTQPREPDEQDGGK